MALRKAFPQELSGLYTSDEMEQSVAATNAAIEASQDASSETGELLNPDQLKTLQAALAVIEMPTDKLIGMVRTVYRSRAIDSLEDIPASGFERCKNWLAAKAAQMSGEAH